MYYVNTVTLCGVDVDACLTIEFSLRSCIKCLTSSLLNCAIKSSSNVSIKYWVHLMNN